MPRLKRYTKHFKYVGWAKHKEVCTQRPESGISFICVCRKLSVITIQGEKYHGLLKLTTRTARMNTAEAPELLLKYSPMKIPR